VVDVAGLSWLWAGLLLLLVYVAVRSFGYGLLGLFDMTLCMAHAWHMVAHVPECDASHSCGPMGQRHVQTGQ
jgi:hypothetical protein